MIARLPAANVFRTPFIRSQPVGQVAPQALPDKEERWFALEMGDWPLSEWAPSIQEPAPPAVGRFTQFGNLLIPIVVRELASAPTLTYT